MINPACGRLAPIIFALSSIIALFPLMLTSCGKTPSMQQLKGFAQGTSYHISYWSAAPIDAPAIKKAVDNEFATIDQLLSNYRPDSVIETFNRNAVTDSQAVGPEIVQLTRIAETVHRASQGCYDLTVKPLFTLWGFDGETPAIPADNAIGEILKRVGMEHLAIVDDTHLAKQLTTLQVDLSSIAQGYSVESLSQVLEQHGITDYMVEIGGELKTRGEKPDHTAWRIAIEKPLPGEHKLHKVLTMPKDQPLAIMTSGTYRHFFDTDGKRYSHILDARSGRPVTHDLVAVTVAHANPTVADAWSTALLCLGQEQGLKIANDQHLAALFIRLTGEQLLESQSNAFSTLNLITQP